MLQALDILNFTIERLWRNRVMVFWALLGLSAATTLALSLVLYVDAVNTNLLDDRLRISAALGGAPTPPYAYRFRYLGAWEGNISQQDVERTTGAIEANFKNTIGLPTARQTNFVRSIFWSLRLTPEGGTASGPPLALGNFNLGTLTGANDLMRIVDGEWPPASEDSPSESTQAETQTVSSNAQGAAQPVADPIPVLVAESQLYTAGVQVGDLITAQAPGGQPITLRVAALWAPYNATDPNWIFTPRFFDTIVLMQPDAFWNAVQGLNEPIEESAWFTVFDGTFVRTSDAAPLLRRTNDAEREMGNILPGIRMDLAPRDGLRVFVQDVERLTRQLVLVILPVGGLVLYFVSLVAGLLVSRQQSEDAVLRSRGMSRRMLLTIHFLMWLLLAGAAFAAGLLIAPYIVRLVGRTASFLQFDNATAPLQVTFTQQALVYGAATAVLAASSGLYLAWRSTGQNILGHRRRNARATQAWWQRSYLDLMVLVPGIYVYYNLSRQGGLTAEDPFSDPLTFLGPTLFALGLTLLFLRVWPFVMRIISGILTYSSNIALLMALRELTRSIGRYRGTLLMMCFTLSLTGYTASMASTIDSSLRDTVDYRIGADTVLVMAADAQTEQGEQTDSGQQTVTVTGFNTLPAEDLLRVEGVRQVSRVGRYPARLSLRSSRVDGTLVGIDRAAIAAVARSRQDYSATPYADLFNLLATNRSGIILSRRTAAENNLLIGQEVPIEVQALNEWYSDNVPIIGVVDYFPTLNPTQGFFALTNLDPIFELVGTELPHDVWLGLEPGADLDAIREAVRELGFPVLEWRDPASELAAEQAEPDRRGVLGFLSVGFVASIVLTLVGTIIQNTVSFRAQATQLGSLRAMGLRGLAVGMYLIFVQGIAALSGILSGTSIGIATTLLFLPLLDFSGGLPPYLVRVAWNEIVVVYVVFAGVLFSVTLLTTMVVSRERLATVVKLGDA
ncbi:MAG: FtsX-like permease family protein [bacterium]|nr:FtsX-like permease family protein [bacterium]